ncbi:CPBP family intramembrane glutamic endopeptidase [Nocardia huaxiensis]|uniref:CPBP family intramembrane glutamic endopeptidase n=1 Tax=Nocardia huaxiensis TaxID=2755382 RepID=UPI001E347B5B|nr:CPBP family intramembrane glutamic endopeptidase [Nocardia huaxiensis]UFS93729.1 CPBP family intramembrane metalloprotease [Nocardia huaxiensis]
MAVNQVRGTGWGVVAAYVALAVVVSGVLLGVQARSGIDAAALSLAQFGPAVAVGVVVLLWGKRIRGVVTAAVDWEDVGGDIAAVVGAVALLGVLVAGAALVGGMELVGPQSVGAVPFAVFVVFQLVGALGEEIGWRGFLQPALEFRYGRLIAVGITGLIWALWHVKAFTLGVVPAVSFLVAAMGFAVVLGYLANGSFVQRVLTATVGHWLINVTLYLVMGDDTLGVPQVCYYAGASFLVAVLVLAWSVARDNARRRDLVGAAD